VCVNFTVRVGYFACSCELLVVLSVTPRASFQVCKVCTFLSPVVAWCKYKFSVLLVHVSGFSSWPLTTEVVPGGNRSDHWVPRASPCVDGS
jgi:hypothetical protein